MKRPNIQVMDEIESIIQDIDEMEEAIRSLKQRLKELPAEMSLQLDVEEERVEAAQYLYWFVPEISSSAIAQGLLDENTYGLKKHIGTAKGIVKCERCGQNIEFRNRTHMQEIRDALKKDNPRYAEGYKVICENCWKEVQQERHKEYEIYEARKQRRLLELKTMPYSEYLKTQEWQVRRKQHLKSAGYRCQVCNSKGVVLDVHHRTYERRGTENYKDLIALCRDCHRLFHKEGRLAVE